MDYKILILAAILIGALIFLYREISTLKDEVRKGHREVRDSVDDTKDEVIKEVKNDLEKTLDKLRTLNLEYIQQVRKMNIIQNQPITKSSNHFTDSESEIGTNLNYLSDTNVVLPKQIVAKNESSFYMSNDEEISPQETQNNSLILLTKNLDISGNNIGTLHNEVILSTENKHDIILNVNIPIDKENTKIPEQITPENIINTYEAKINEQNNIEDPEDNDDQEPIDDNENIDDDIEDNDTSVEVDATELLKKYNISSQKNIDKLIDDNITIGSKNIEEKENPEEDTQSVETGIIDSIDITSLKDINKYNITGIRKIAKHFGITLNSKVDGKWKQHNKKYLYTKVKDLLSKNKKS
jgi:hypothetical protein